MANSKFKKSPQNEIKLLEFHGTLAANQKPPQTLGEKHELFK
jgi:hypothetical protein